jgi:UDP-N-acetylmuramate--alanine ligase
MKIHFIGIGGIGLSALAQYYLAKGHKISGSDLVSSKITDFLREKGAKIFIGKHKAENLAENVNKVIYSPAITPANPELKKAKRLKIKCLSYPQALGELTKKYFTIAISGTHGKSTTSAMIALILIKANFDPTVIIGTKLKEFSPITNLTAVKNVSCLENEGTNFRLGKSKYLVIEADEWRASFLNYWPKILVLTNIEREHLDYYKNLDQILRTYREYVSHLPKEGVLVANGEDKNIERMLNLKQIPNLKFQIQKFSLKQEGKVKKLKEILKIPGQHNIFNALAALKVAQILKIPDKISFEALSEYRGSWRRFEEREIEFSNFNICLVSDYAHHPTEIKATLAAAREKWPNRKIWAIFQPHQYQRTYFLFDDFVKAFEKANEIIITEIFKVKGREKRNFKES